MIPFEDDIPQEKIKIDIKDADFSEFSTTIIEPNKMKYFPYAFIGLVRCLFDGPFGAEQVEGVGMIIGADIVLTSADILYYATNQDNFKYPQSISFFPLINGNIQLYNGICCNHYIIPEGFPKLKQKQSAQNWKAINTEEIVFNNYGILILPVNIGEEIVRLFGYKQDPRFEYTDDGLRIFKFVEEQTK